jgi:hypothetical protein
MKLSNTFQNNFIYHDLLLAQKWISALDSAHVTLINLFDESAGHV